MTAQTKLGDMLADLYIAAYACGENPGDPVAFFDDNVEEGMATSARVAHLKVFRKRVNAYVDRMEDPEESDSDYWYDHLDRQYQTQDDNYIPFDDGSDYDPNEWRDY